MMRGCGLLHVLDIDPADGALSMRQIVQMRCHAARGAAFSPDGRFLLVAATDAEIIVTYRILEDGTLKEVAESEKLPHPASIAFLEKI